MHKAGFEMPRAVPAYSSLKEVIFLCMLLFGESYVGPHCIAALS